jgi:hypothetical protein
MNNEQADQVQSAGIQTQANVEFTLHVHFADGTTKDIKCLGLLEANTQQNQE